MSASAAHRSPFITHTGITGPLLLVHFFAATRDFRTSLRLCGTNTQIRLIHHDRVVKQHFINAIGDLGQIEREHLTRRLAIL